VSCFVRVLQNSILLVRSVDAHLFANSADDMTKSITCRAIGEVVKETLAKVASHADARIQWNRSKERNRHVLGQTPGTAGSGLEDLTLVGAFRTHEARHVLDDTEDLDASLATEINLLSHVQQTDFLWCGDDDGAIDARLFEETVDTEMFVAGTGRGVYNEIVQLAPFDILEELLDQAVLLGTAPDDSIVTVGKHELDAHDAQVLSDPDRAPSSIAHMDGFLFYTHHLGDTGATDIGIHDSDLRLWVRSKCMPQHSRKRRFTHTTLATENQNLVLYRSQAGGDERNIRIGAFGGCGTDLLVRASCAGIAFAGALGLGAGTVFGFGSDEFGGGFERSVDVGIVVAFD